MSAMEGGGRGRPPILPIDIVHSIDTVTTSGEAIGEVVPIHDRRWAMVHAAEATDDRIARMKRLGAGATVTANLMSMAGGRFDLQESGGCAMPSRRVRRLETWCVMAAIPDFELDPALPPHGGDPTRPWVEPIPEGASR